MLKHTPYYHRFAAAGATFKDRCGFATVDAFSTVAEEHQATRERVGMFDVFNEAAVEIKGRDAEKLLMQLMTGDVRRMRDRSMLYGVLCNDQGGIFDELLCFRFTANRFWLTPSPARVAEVAAYIEGRAADLNVSVTNLGYANAYLSVQGPRSRELLATLTDADLSNAGLPFGRLTEDRLGGVPKAVIARSGYSGELGYELFFPVEYAEHVWDAVATAGEPFGIRPCGMKTMRSLRIEKMYFLYGLDISGRTDPLSAGLDSIVQFDDRAFVGRAALEDIAEMGIQQRLCLLDCGAIHPIATGDAVNADGQQVATVTSADPGYTLGSTFAFAHLPVKLAMEGAEVLVTSKTVAEPIKARVLLRAPYDPDRRRLTS